MREPVDETFSPHFDSIRLSVNHGDWLFAEVVAPRIMRKSTLILLATAFMILLLVVAALNWPAFSRDRTGRAMIGKPVVKSISTFLAPGDLEGSSYILLSDMYVDECNTRQHEFSNLVVKLRDEGTTARMLHIGSHAFPFRSYEEAVSAKRAPTHIVLSDESVAYANSSVYWLTKPCVIELDDGEVVDIRVGADFEEWVNNQ